MANEIGYWNSGAGASTQSAFAGDSIGPVQSAVHAAGAGETITAIRFNVSNIGSTTTAKVGLFQTSAGLPTGAPVQTYTFTGLSGNGVKSASVSWALTNGVSYALVLGETNAIMQVSGDSLASGSTYDDITGDLSTYTHRSYKALQIELAGDITTSSSPVLPALLATVTRRIGA